MRRKEGEKEKTARKGNEERGQLLRSRKRRCVAGKAKRTQESVLGDFLPQCSDFVSQFL
jgi:hypothetical protein